LVEHGAVSRANDWNLSDDSSVLQECLQVISMIETDLILATARCKHKNLA
jgi:hypothetical protein